MEPPQDEASGLGPSGALPRGPYPTLGPDTPVLPRWPGPLMIIVGAVLGIGTLGVSGAAAEAQLDIDGRILLPLLLLSTAMLGGGLVYSSVRQIQRRRVLAPDRYRGPTIIVLLAMVLLINVVLGFPFTADALALGSGEGQLSLLGAIVILLAMPIALLLVSGLFVAVPNALAGLASLPGRNPAGALATGFGLGVVAWIGSTALLVIAAWVLDQLGMAPDPGVAQRALEQVQPWLIVPAVVIAAPIAEEAFFRGVVFNAWLREGGRTYAYIGSAALFAVIHLELVNLVPIFALGLALAWVYERTGSLLAPMAMHATVNGISAAIALLVRFDVLRLPG